MQPAEILPSEAHIAAKTGQIDALEEELLEGGDEILTERDQNGWQVLHQGVAGGHEHVVKLLIDNGAEINSRTHGGYGETPLRIAEKTLGIDHPIVRYLKELGALSIGPEL
jgi:ankyrin repeat protein